MITAKLLRQWGACWDDDRIAAMGRTEMSPREIAADDSISLDDRLWVICKALWHLDELAARLYAIETALSVAHLAGDDDDQAQFLGLMNDLLCAEDLDGAAARDAAWAAAWAAARAAAWDAARAAAWDAARDAARDAAWAAAWAAARAAAWDAARDAAWAAARDADLKKSIDRALEFLGDYADGWIDDDAAQEAA